MARALKFAIWGGVLLVVICYAIFIPLKLNDLMPDRDWLRILVGPPLFAFQLVYFVWVHKRFPAREFVPLLLMCVVLIGFLFVVN